MLKGTETELIQFFSELIRFSSLFLSLSLITLPFTTQTILVNGDFLLYKDTPNIFRKTLYRVVSQSRSLCEVWETGLFSRTIGGSEIRRSSSPKEEFWSVFTKLGMSNFMSLFSSSSGRPLLLMASWI